MIVVSTTINDVKIIQPNIFSDDRGFFMETFEKKRYQEALQINLNFVQDNYSHSKKNVLRGLHIQQTKPQGKLIRVIMGEIFDVFIDLRDQSPTFGQWSSIILSEQNKKQLWIPPGFAHGLFVLSDTANIEYKCTEYYHPEDEICLLWNDPDLNIKWPSMTPILSIKDKNGLLLKDFLSLRIK
ncbi:dTDP-4-dehydrorhamnose 3,5-epimerase [Neisseria sp. Ec49-e6-T10]|uniref:dTDP-4-dehydrorhamnose 3,5-epimerase n=1 Tax=Neisseria sp. Ec49-e6-T10 TaxID=3140744 RepID=UPI003EBE2721